jgi:hypothetical protein
VARAHAYDFTMLVLAGLLAVGFVLNLLVRPPRPPAIDGASAPGGSRPAPAVAAGASGGTDAPAVPGLAATVRIVLLWLLVAAPLAWGFLTTLRQARALLG